MFWPEVSRGQDVEGEDVGVYNGLIGLWCVSNTTWSQTRYGSIDPDKPEIVKNMKTDQNVLICPFALLFTVTNEDALAHL